MPTNVTPQYRNAELEFKAAKTTEDKIAALEKMIALLPKHKGTDHLYGDLKRRLSKLRNESARKASRSGPNFNIPREGVAQIVLLGAPNTGKSSVVSRLTNANSQVAAYPFTTRIPVPGMMAFEDIHIQLIDLPPITEQFLEPWVPDMIRRANAALIIVDLGDDDALDQADIVLGRLEKLKIILRGEIPQDLAPEDRNRYRRAMLIGNKLDREGAEERLRILHELCGERMPILALSAATGAGCDEFRRALFDFLRLIRVYTKVPGKEADLKAPFALPRGSTVLELAQIIHKELAAKITSARIWGAGVYAGQHVRLDHVLNDHDIVELHG